MEKENVIVMCCQCGGHFNKKDVHRLRIENVPVELYICKPCLENMPRLSTHVDPPLRKV